MKNVRCTNLACRVLLAGNDVYCGLGKNPHIRDGDERVQGHRYSPCGWRGERYNSVSYGVADTRDLTAKPCPRCGGTVTLIDRDGAT